MGDSEYVPKAVGKHFICLLCLLFASLTWKKCWYPQ